SRLELHSFPTRRSSDLGLLAIEELLAEEEGLREPVGARLHGVLQVHTEAVAVAEHALEGGAVLGGRDDEDVPDPSEHERAQRVRSEEHTSELQSRFDLV